MRTERCFHFAMACPARVTEGSPRMLANER
jgi:hypothetical protein